jgi:hypothetical protein
LGAINNVWKHLGGVMVVCRWHCGGRTWIWHPCVWIISGNGAFWCNAIRTHLAHRYRQTPPRLDLAQPLAIGGNAFWWCIRRWRCVGTFVVCMTINEMTVWQLPKMMRWRLSFDMFSCDRLVPCEKSSRVLDGDYGVLSQVTKCEN